MPIRDMRSWGKIIQEIPTIKWGHSHRQRYDHVRCPVYGWDLQDSESKDKKSLGWWVRQQVGPMAEQLDVQGLRQLKRNILLCSCCLHKYHFQSWKQSAMYRGHFRLHWKSAESLTMIRSCLFQIRIFEDILWQKEASGKDLCLLWRRMSTS